MKKKPPDQKLSNQEIIDSYDYLGKAASAMDCTGLIPRAPLSPEELASYEEVYPFRPPHIGEPPAKGRPAAQK